MATRFLKSQSIDILIASSPHHIAEEGKFSHLDTPIVVPKTRNETNKQTERTTQKQQDEQGSHMSLISEKRQ